MVWSLFYTYSYQKKMIWQFMLPQRILQYANPRGAPKYAYVYRVIKNIPLTNA